MNGEHDPGRAANDEPEQREAKTITTSPKTNCAISMAARHSTTAAATGATRSWLPLLLQKVEEQPIELRRIFELRHVADAWHHRELGAGE